MNGIILLTHAPLASALLDCVNHIYGYKPENMIAINVQGDDTQNLINAKIEDWMHEKQYDGYLILNDLYGASPFNMAKNFLDKNKNKDKDKDKDKDNKINPDIMLISGVNLPMLMKCVCHQNLPLEQMAQKSLDAILQCSTMLRQASISVTQPNNANIKI
jgi:mannose PTS system EIIA component